MYQRRPRRPEPLPAHLKKVEEAQQEEGVDLVVAELEELGVEMIHLLQRVSPPPPHSKQKEDEAVAEEAEGGLVLKVEEEVGLGELLQRASQPPRLRAPPQPEHHSRVRRLVFSTVDKRDGWRMVFFAAAALKD